MVNLKNYFIAYYVPFLILSPCSQNGINNKYLFDKIQVFDSVTPHTQMKE